MTDTDDMSLIIRDCHTGVSRSAGIAGDLDGLCVHPACFKAFSILDFAVNNDIGNVAPAFDTVSCDATFESMDMHKCIRITYAVERRRSYPCFTPIIKCAHFARTFHLYSVSYCDRTQILYAHLVYFCRDKSSQKFLIHSLEQIFHKQYLCVRIHV